MNKILVVGSSNTDMVIKTSKFPAPGETILGGDFFMNAGGKGANQAVAAKRLGGNVSFLGKIGDDIFGKQALQNLKDDGIDVEPVRINKDKPSGIALITIDAKGENSIVVAPGANETLLPEDIDEKINEIESSDFILLQLEIPLSTVNYITEIASGKGKKVVLNPAPADKLLDALLADLYMLIPNETEAELLTGICVKDVKTAEQAAQYLKNKGVQIVIITMGSKGAFVLSDEFKGMIEALEVAAVDTTSAGDTFCGALVAKLSNGTNLKQAIEFATTAAAICVTRMGAQMSIPHEKEVSEFFN
ncbi:ribokinase [Maribellus maritimus]|uniref:ribokinase n=1 Tax=Maribellus maritimus TaxID=2870838 RepID=UPI001EE9F1BA|nr:ribokinase [Maribellus maritimus]MCG6190623.1 ribokinase [Maribellus maritimus]